MKIIGICGKAKSGKDTAASFLMDTNRYRQTAFANRLKECIKLVYDLTDEDVYDIEKKELPHPNLGGKTIRSALQFLGTEGFRTFYDNTWTNVIEREIRQYIRACAILREVPRDYLITDCRYPNELDAIKEWGGHIIYINRPSLDLSNVKYQHSSETMVEAALNPKYKSIIIDNDSTLEAFEEKVMLAIDSIPDCVIGLK